MSQEAKKLKQTALESWELYQFQDNFVKQDWQDLPEDEYQPDFIPSGTLPFS